MQCPSSFKVTESPVTIRADKASGLEVLGTYTPNPIHPINPKRRFVALGLRRVSRDASAQRRPTHDFGESTKKGMAEAGSK